MSLDHKYAFEWYMCSGAVNVFVHIHRHKILYSDNTSMPITASHYLSDWLMTTKMMSAQKCI